MFRTIAAAFSCLLVVQASPAKAQISEATGILMFLNAVMDLYENTESTTERGISIGRRIDDLICDATCRGSIAFKEGRTQDAVRHWREASDCW